MDLKVKDFAAMQGVSDSIIYRHIRQHKEALGDRVVKRGNATWLTEEGQEYLRGLMTQQPIVVGDGEIYRENEDLKKKIELLQDKLIAAHEKIETQQMQLDQGRETLLLLQAAEKETKILEGFVADAKAEIKALHEEKVSAVAAARQEGAADAEQRFRSMSVFEFLRERRKGK